MRPFSRLPRAETRQDNDGAEARRLKQPLDLERARQKKFRLLEPGIIYRCVGKR
jgi:hypothetical protein